MSTYPLWLAVLGWALAALMFVYGLMFFVNRRIGYMITAHTESGAPSIVGARFFMLGALAAIFLYLGNTQALIVLLVVGALVGLTDMMIEKPHGGAAWPHVTAAIGAAVLAYLFYTTPLAGSL